MLDGDQQLTHILRQGLGEQHAQRGVELIDIAQRLNAQMVFGHTRAVTQASAAIVSGAGGDLGQAVAHGDFFEADALCGEAAPTGGTGGTAGRGGWDLAGSADSPGGHTTPPKAN